jgi:hypothetical protein
MTTLQNGILIAKIAPFAFNLTGFYFTPIGGETKCLLLDPSIDKSNRIFPLSEILSSGAFSTISYRELINPNDSKRFKLALVNMQSSFDSNNLETAIRDDIIGKSRNRSICNIFDLSEHSQCSWDNYASAHIDYISKAVGQNPAERIKQCSGECYVGTLPDIKSYDPFFPPKIFHRDIPPITNNDKLRLKAWADFFSISYRGLSTPYIDLQDSVPSITLATPYRVSKDPDIQTITSIQKPNDTLFQYFLINQIDDGTYAGNVNPVKIPLSFRVPAEYIFTDDINNNEKMITTWGLNIYDGACWEIALWLLKDNNSSLLDDIRSSRKTTQFASIISNNVNSQKSHKYLSPISIGSYTSPTGPQDPFIRNITYPYDPNGLSFQTISNYYSYDPIKIIPQQWNNNAKYWNDFRPISGVNSWFYGLSPFIRNANIPNFKGYSGFNSILFNMMDSNSGFFHSPINNFNTTLTIFNNDNASIYAALSHIKSYLSANPSINIGISIGQLSTMMIGIEQLFASLADKENFFFHQGKIWIPGSGWHLNATGIKIDFTSSSYLVPFAVTINDVNMPINSTKTYLIPVQTQLWTICSLQPKIIDKIFGVHGATLKLWNNLKNTCGRFNHDHELDGFGFNNIKSTYDNNMSTVISAELTFTAMMACKILKEYYQDTADIAPYSITSDLAEMETFIYTPSNHLLFISNNEAYFNSANIRSQTGFGSFVNPIPSITSTSWHIFYSKLFNPFVPNGTLLR